MGKSIEIYGLKINIPEPEKVFKNSNKKPGGFTSNL